MLRVDTSLILILNLMFFPDTKEAHNLYMYGQMADCGEDDNDFNFNQKVDCK